jgi:hypothetical protein
VPSEFWGCSRLALRLMTALAPLSPALGRSREESWTLPRRSAVDSSAVFPLERSRTPRHLRLPERLVKP